MTGFEAMQKSIDDIRNDAERYTREYETLGAFGDPNKRAEIALCCGLLMEKALGDVFYPPCGVSDKMARDSVADQLGVSIAMMGTTISMHLKFVRRVQELEKKIKAEDKRKDE